MEALEQQLVDRHQQLAASKSRLTRARRFLQQKLDDCTQQREHARQEVVRLRSQMQPLQLERDKSLESADNRQHHPHDNIWGGGWEDSSE